VLHSFAASNGIAGCTEDRLGLKTAGLSVFQALSSDWLDEVALYPRLDKFDGVMNLPRELYVRRALTLGAPLAKRA
jgi:hypothetical protein